MKDAEFGIVLGCRVPCWHTSSCSGTVSQLGCNFLTQENRVYLRQTDSRTLSVETTMVICTNLINNITGAMFYKAQDQAQSNAAFSVVPSLDAAARAQLSEAKPLHSSQGPGPPALLVVAG